MKVINCENYSLSSLAAAKMLAQQLALNPASVIGLPTGSTPLGMYNRLSEMYAKGEIDFSKAVSFNLDEYYPIKKTDKNSYYYFMNEHFYSKVNLLPENIYIPYGETENPEQECADYDRFIYDKGCIDILFLGIGKNGHIGFNEPSESLISGTHLCKLSGNTIKANSRFFKSEAMVPRNAITMGIKTILSAKKIVLLANYKAKKAALKMLFSGRITTFSPATMLNLHSDVTVILDEG